MQADKFRVLCQMAVMNAKTLDDAEALSVKELYPEWSYLCETGYKATEAGFKFRYASNGETKLYKTIQENFTFQSQWIPGEGTESLYAVIDETHAGTQEDPIPYDGNMALENGKYYSQDGVIYLCNRDTEIPVYQDLKDLVNIYVTVAE